MTTFFTRLRRLLEIRKLRNRLLFLFACMLVIPNVLISYSSYNSASNELHSKMEDNMKSSVSLMNDSLTNIVQAEVRNVEQLAMQIDSAQVDAKSPEARSLIDLFMEKHPELEILVVGNEKGSWMKAPDPGKQQQYDPRERDWYKASLKSPDETVILDPFKSSTTGHFNLYISRALKNKQGAVSVSLNLASLNAMVKQVRLGENGYIYLLDRTNKYASHPTIAIGEQAKGDYLNKMQGSGSGFYGYENEKTNAQESAYYTTNKLTGFKVVGVLDNKEFSDASMPIFWTGLIAVGVTLVVASILLFFVVRNITRPIEHLNNSAKRVTEGYLNEDVTTKRKDEIGQLAANYNEMLASLRSMVKEMSETASQLAASSEELNAGAEQNAKAVEYVVELVQGASTDAETQAKASEDTAKTMEEMSLGIRKIAESSGTIVESSIQTENDVQLGSEKVSQVGRQMEEIRRTTEQSAALMNQMNDLSEQVAGMSGAISDIAVQTNLLALNASIEAARAGEHGRGFTVVATQVRKLAAQSRETAEMIQDNIAQMTELTKKAYQVMSKEVTSNVEQGISITGEAQSAFCDIEVSTKRISEQIHEVSAITQQMSASADEVADSVERIAVASSQSLNSFQGVTAATEQQLATTEEITSASEGLAKMAADMHQQIDRFKL